MVLDTFICSLYFHFKAWNFCFLSTPKNNGTHGEHGAELKEFLILQQPHALFCLLINRTLAI